MADEATRFMGRDNMLVALVEATAQQAADKAADRAVHDTFRLLGVDLTNDTDVRATRESMSAMRDRWHARQDSKLTRRHAAIQSFFTVIVGLVSAFIGVKFGAH